MRAESSPPIIQDWRGREMVDNCHRLHLAKLMRSAVHRSRIANAIASEQE
jgi:hypothetical protein